MTYWNFLITQHPDVDGHYDPDSDMITIYLGNLLNSNDLMSTIEHENLHAAITWACEDSTAQGEHWIMRKIGFD